MNKSKVKANIIIGFGGQLCILVLGIIVPRVLLTNYGSDVTGLLSTVTPNFYIYGSFGSRNWTSCSKCII